MALPLETKAHANPGRLGLFENGDGPLGGDERLVVAGDDQPGPFAPGDVHELRRRNRADRGDRRRDRAGPARSPSFGNRSNADRSPSCRMSTRRCWDRRERTASSRPDRTASRRRSRTGLRSWPSLKRTLQMPRLPTPIRQRWPHATQRMRSPSGYAKEPTVVCRSSTSARLGLAVCDTMLALYSGEPSSVRSRFAGHDCRRFYRLLTELGSPKICIAAKDFPPVGQ